MSQSTDLWKKAKQIIPGGNQLLSKRAEMFLPDQWPAYFKKAKGLEIWDMDDNRYVDMSIMGIGACVLGYADDELNAAVKKAIDNGNASTLNSYEEVALAQKLMELHPWADMARFARTGGEMNAVAIRIARAYTGKDKIAFCGYHGWHDWYLAANIDKEKNLDQQLLAGLHPSGVPQGLKETALPFHYGNVDELKDIVRRHGKELGVIIMEVTRYQETDASFLKTVRALADETGAVLIFDEISSGFRANTGGMHLLYDITPDMVTLGKALGGGYPIAAVLGKKKVMEAAQGTFISSTFWTERLGYVAALETIRQYQEYKVPEHLVSMGEYMKNGLREIVKNLSLNISIAGMPAAPVLSFKEKKALVLKTVFTQEMLKKGFLAAKTMYMSKAHTPSAIDDFLDNAQHVLQSIDQAHQDGRIEDLLEGPVCHSGFNRLN